MQKPSLKKTVIILFCLAEALFLLWFFWPKQDTQTHYPRIKLMSPILKSNISIEESIQQRRSIRTFSKEQLNLQQLSQLLWAGQGITSANGFRAAPSAGSKYPLEIYVISNQIHTLKPGIYHYLPLTHELEKRSADVPKDKLYAWSYQQKWVRDAPLLLIIAANFSKTEAKYHKYAPPYVYMEAGHAAQNIMLQSVSLNLGIVGVGGFAYSKIDQLLGLKHEKSLYILCIGKKVISTQNRE
jgi:SagB-type dehydrogenase family enzyme